MRPQDIDAVKHIGLLQDVDPSTRDELLKGSFLQRFPAHVDLVREGEPADFLHIVVDGKVELFATYRDRETTIAVIGPGKYFITAAVLLDRIYLKSARTLSPSRVLLIPADAVRTCFTRDGALAMAVATDLASSYRELVKEVKNQKLRSGLERLANWLLAQYESAGQPRRFELPYEKRILASRLGMVPEVLSRSFAALAEYNVVVDGRCIEIRDPRALRALAKATPTIDDPST